MSADTDGLLARLGRRLGLAPPFDQLAGAWVPLALILASALTSASLILFQGTEPTFLLRQDLPVFAACMALTAALGWLRVRALARLAPGAAAPGWFLVAALAGVCAVVGALGLPLVFHGYDLTLDEYLANFDAQIFSHGQLMAPVDAAWRPFAEAMQPVYMLPVPGGAHWVSGYLPINAALRALASRAGLEDWVNPLLGGFSVIAVYAVARRLWPARPGMALGAAALLGSSAQLIVTGMTAYAMPAHLAFNLAWLWLYLRGGRLGHAGALAVGFLACGIHQLPFHPLFVAPFVLGLWLERRWALAGLYTLAYTAFCGFWAEYWGLELMWQGVGGAGAGAHGVSFLQRALALIGQVRPGNLGAMAASIVRFATWQNPLTAPLLLVGSLAAWRERGVMRALILGVALTLLAVLILEPSQTHGWGYRYLHGLLGSIVLIGIWTWTRLVDPLPAEARAAAKGGFVLAAVAALALLAPWRIWQAAQFVRPYAEADALIHQAPEPVVVVDNQAPWFDVGTVVRNDPFLARGPKVMWLAALSEAQIRALCAKGPVGLMDGRQVAALGAADVFSPPIVPEMARRRALLLSLGCARPLS